MWRCAGKCGEVLGGTERCNEAGTGRCDEVLGGVGRCGEVLGGVEKLWDVQQIKGVMKMQKYRCEQNERE